MKHFLALLLFPLFAQANCEPQSMLFQAEAIGKKFLFEVAKTPPPSPSPQPERCLDTASVWFSLDLNELPSPAFEQLAQEELWDILKEIGVEAIHLKGLKKGGLSRTQIGLDPKWGEDWPTLSMLAQKKKIAFIGDTLGSSTGLGPDFFLALKNVGDYPGLYHLIEIEKRDWKALPTVAPAQLATNVPWLTLQQLHKKGYVPEEFSPYVKESRWNATSPIRCEDGKVRRWIYLKENELDPVIDWLNPSFSGCRIAASDTLDSIYNLGQKIVQIDGEISSNAKETLALWTRKLGSFSAVETQGGLSELKNVSADLMTDTLTRPALLHALLAEDAEALKLMYRLYLEEGIETKRLVHILQPFDQYVCDWSLLQTLPKKRFQYYDEILTGEALRMRLLKQDAATLGGPDPSTWPKLCMTSLGIDDSAPNREDLGELHLLLSFFYALQPGAFSFSASDLLGTLTHGPIQLLGTNEKTIYPSLPGQMKNSRSFAMQLRKILAVRRDSQIAKGELLAIPDTKQRGLMVLIHRLPNNMTQLLAVNFSKAAAQETFELPNIRQTSAIDLLSGLAEKKAIESSTFQLNVAPLSGKVILFQTKYYD